MQEQFIQYIQDNKLLGPGESVLLGVSGGVDSVVMMHLFLEGGYRIGIAHCNYQLRGEESEEDHLFLRELARRYDLPFYEKRFNTKDYASRQHLSVQMAARKLLYDWFEQLRAQVGYDRIAVGHNRDDMTETFLINLARGTGLKGLTGIKPRWGNVVRPLLFAGRGEILEYCRQQQLVYREDSTNQTVHYHRNKIRHQVIPVFQQMNPRFLETMAENVQRLQEAHDLYRLFVEEKKQELLQSQGEEVYISKQVKELGSGYSALLFEILQAYGFTGRMVGDIAGEMDGIPGKEYFSNTHKLLRDRNWLIVTPLDTECFRRYYLEDVAGQVTTPMPLRLRKIQKTHGYDIPRHPDIASVDYDKLDFPLILRKWQEGDYFIPLGMNDFKKLSDFFVDRKYSRLDKERAWLLTSGEKIVWIVGDRLDERFRIEAQTKCILEITLLREN